MNNLDARIDQYLRLRRALGFTLERHERYIRQFAAHLDRVRATSITVEQALAWATAPGGAAAYHAARLTAIRIFLRWLATFDADIEVPPAHLLAQRAARLQPYIYTNAEVDALLTGARQLRSPLKGATYSTLIALLACTGLRVGEALRADVGDLDDDVLTVADTKFGKTRLVPLHASTVAALETYRRTLTRQLTLSLDTPALLVSTAGTRLLYQNVHHVFHRLVAEAGIQARSPRCRPRIHDLRHTFAVNTMIDAYRSQDTPAAVLPALSVYLGHANPANTYWYLEAVPELLTAAADRSRLLSGPVTS